MSLSAVVKSIIATALLASAGAVLATPSTYDFTGLVLSTSGSYSSVALNTAVSGSASFDLSAITLTSGTAPGSGNEYYYSTPAPGSSSLLFSQTLDIGGVSYGDPGDLVAGSASSVIGSDYYGDGYYASFSVDTPGIGAFLYGEGLFDEGPNASSNDVMLADGSPNLAPDIAAGAQQGSGGPTGSYQDLNGSITYALTSFTPAPASSASVPAPLSSGLLGLGLAALMLRRRRAV